MAKIKKLEDIGEINFAGEWASQLHDRVKNKLLDMNNHGADNEKLLRILIKIIVRQLHILNHQLGEPQILKEYPYFLKNYKKSLFYLQRAKKNSKYLFGEKLIIARISAINLGYLGDNLTFEKAKKEVLQICQDDHYRPEVSSAYEGLARAEGRLKNNNYQKTLDKAWKIYGTINERMDLKLLRKFQLARTEIEICSYKKSVLPSSMRRFGIAIVKEAKEYGFNRYAELINNLLVSSLQTVN